ncbi:hypothetical protein Q7P35_002366 [Cladosporium inversicolor]
MNFFNPSVKTPLHIVYIILVVAAMGFSVPRLFMKGQPRTRANTIALGMGAKSLIFIAYQISTEHVQALRRWQSYKAYWILNALETVFWGAVVFLVMQANLARCVGVGCKLSWAVMALGIVLNILASYLTVVCFLDYRRRRNTTYGVASDASDSNGVESDSNFRMVGDATHKA